jgi:hypothetical protein
MTGAIGTAGAETIVTVELEPTNAGTSLRLVHARFYDQAGVERHEQAWAQHVLPHLDATLAAG